MVTARLGLRQQFGRSEIRLILRHDYTLRTNEQSQIGILHYPIIIFAALPFNDRLKRVPIQHVDSLLVG